MFQRLEGDILAATDKEVSVADRFFFVPLTGRYFFHPGTRLICAPAKFTFPV
jgi:hypothetical protein